jgi:hypothetical protein
MTGAAVADATRSRVEAHAKRQFGGQGRWRSGQPGRQADQHSWHVHVERSDDGSVTGRVAVIGSPSLHSARIQGHVTGSDVYGVLLDESDSQLGTFSGTVSSDGLNGTYQTADGDSGTWSWDGPPPQ